MSKTRSESEVSTNLPKRHIIYLPEYITWEDERGFTWKIETATGDIGCPAWADANAVAKEIAKMCVTMQAQMEALCSYIEDLEIEIEQEDLDRIHGETTMEEMAQLRQEMEIVSAMQNQKQQSQWGTYQTQGSKPPQPNPYASPSPGGHAFEDLLRIAGYTPKDSETD